MSTPVKSPKLKSPLSSVRKQLKEGNLDAALSGLRETLADWNTKSAGLVKDLGAITSAAKRLDPANRNLLETAVRDIELNSPHMNETLYNTMRPALGGSYRLQRAAFHSIQTKSNLAPSRHITAKQAAAAFAKMLGLDTPIATQQNVSHTQIAIDGPSVIKPGFEDGGRAIFGIVPRDGVFHDIFSGTTYESLGDVHAQLHNQLSTKRVRRDYWMNEELLVAPDGITGAMDIKFYVFYGRVGYVLQVDRWGDGGKKYTFFTPDGQVADTGKYKLPEEPPTPAFTAQDIALAENISLEIPWPGLRIDFLAADRGLVFGEFTLNPGAGGSFNQVSDAHLGDLWSHGQARLLDDMLRGKSFDAYNAFLEAQAANADVAAARKRR